MKKYIGRILLPLVLVACETKKVPISGTRIPVVTYESTVKVDTDAESIKVVLPTPVGGLAWPQVGGNAAHVMPNLALKESGELLWRTSIGSGNGEGRLLSSPVVNKGVVYTLDTYGQVMAIKAASGEPLWQIDISPEGQGTPLIGGGLAVGKGKVFVTSPYAEVLALDAETGKILWRFATRSPVRAAPTFAEGRLYALTISNHLVVLDGETGTLLWEHAGITEYAGLLGSPSPAVSKGVVIVTYSSGEIYALKAENGHPFWTETLSSTHRPDSLSALSHIRSLPLIDQNIVIIVGHNQKMAAYDLLRGERLWERNIGGTRTPALVGGFIFMINSHNELLCLTRDYGQVIWVKKLDFDPERPHKVVWSGPLVAGSKLFIVNASGRLVTLDPSTGNILSQRELGISISLPPLVAQEILYILADDGDLMAFQ